MTAVFRAKFYGRKKGFIEEIKAPIFLEAVLAIETIQMSLFNLEEN